MRARLVCFAVAILLLALKPAVTARALASARRSEGLKHKAGRAPTQQPQMLEDVWGLKVVASAVNTESGQAEETHWQEADKQLKTATERQPLMELGRPITIIPSQGSGKEIYSDEDIEDAKAKASVYWAVEEAKTRTQTHQRSEPNTITYQDKMIMQSIFGD